MGQVIPSESNANTASIMLSGVTTTSATFVSTGIGITLTKKNGGNLLAFGQLDCFATGGVTRLNYRLYYSKIGIPLAGASPDASDLTIGAVSLVDPSGTSILNTLPLAGYKTGATGTFFIYVAFNSGNGVNTNSLDGGQLNGVEL